MIATKRTIPANKLEKVAEILKAIAHPIRLEVLETLEFNEPLTVSEIRAQVDMEVEQSLLSHHLIKLKDKGVLQSVKKGKYIYYSISDRQVLKIFDCMEKCDFI